MARRTPGVRTSNPGDRLDNPHRRSYLRFATVAFPVFDQFLQDAECLPADSEVVPPGLKSAWAEVHAECFDHQLAVARRELAASCPSLSANQLGDLAPLVARKNSCLVSVDRVLSPSQEYDPLQPGDPLARTPLPHFLVGCAWLNAPAEVTAARANAYLDDYFQDGVPTGATRDSRDRYGRSRKAFAEFIYTRLLDDVNGRGQLIAPADIWRLPSKTELAIRTVWMRPDIAARRAKFHRDVGRKSDVGDFARGLALDGQLHSLIWHAMKDTHHRAAQNPHAIVEFGAAKLRIQHAALAVLKAEQARRPTEAHGAPG